MGVLVELDNAQIVLSGWAGKDTPSKCKRVGGGRFHKASKTWRFPLDMMTCRALRTEFGQELEIGSRLNRWARREVNCEKRLAAFLKDGTASLPNVEAMAPTIAKAIRPYQKVGAAWGAGTGNFLLADEQGLGKTIETLATILERADRPQWHVIFAPLVAIESTWGREVRRWLGQDLNIAVVPLLGSLKARQEILENLDIPYETQHVFVIANIESARIKPTYDEDDDRHKRPKYNAANAVLPALHARVWDTVVVDECQRALIRTSGVPTQARAGFQVLSKNSRRRIALSGTPMRGKPEQLWGTLNWLRPDVYTSYWKWVERYFSITSDGYSNYILNGFLPGGQDRLAADLKPIMLRRTKAEVLPELPPKTYGGSLLDPDDPLSPVGVWLDPLPAQVKQTRQVEDEGVLNFGDDGEVMVDGTLAEYTRRKQLADAVHVIETKQRYKNGDTVTTLRPTLQSSKYEWLVDYLAELDGAKLVVASQFTSVIEVFADGLRELGYKVAVLTGKTPQKRRAELVAQFQDTDEIQVFMLNTKAGGVSLTLDAADYLVLLDETTVPDDQAQVEDRIHRASRMHNVTIFYLRTLGTIDEEVALIAAAREDVQRYLMDGARGIAYARKLFHEKEKKVA